MAAMRTTTWSAPPTRPVAEAGTFRNIPDRGKSAADDNIRRLGGQVKNDFHLLVPQLKKNLFDLIPQRTAGIPPIRPISGHKLLDHRPQRIRVDPIIGDLYSFFVMVGWFVLGHESPQ